MSEHRNCVSIDVANQALAERDAEIERLTEQVEAALALAGRLRDVADHAWDCRRHKASRVWGRGVQAPLPLSCSCGLESLQSGDLASRAQAMAARLRALEVLQRAAFPCIGIPVDDPADVARLHALAEALAAVEEAKG